MMPDLPIDTDIPEKGNLFQLQVYSRHPWFTDVHVRMDVEIVDEAVSKVVVEWYCGKKPIPKPTTVKELIWHIDLAYRFTSLAKNLIFIPLLRTVELPLQKLRQCLLEHVYDQPLEIPITLVEVLVCGCNMGHCGEPVSFDIPCPVASQTYGDVFRQCSFGEKNPDGSFKYFDSNFCHLNHLTKPLSLDGSSSSAERVPTRTMNFDTDQVYVAFSWYR